MEKHEKRCKGTCRGQVPMVKIPVREYKRLLFGHMNWLMIARDTAHNAMKYPEDEYMWVDSKLIQKLTGVAYCETDEPEEEEQGNDLELRNALAAAANTEEKLSLVRKVHEDQINALLQLNESIKNENEKLRERCECLEKVAAEVHDNDVLINEFIQKNRHVVQRYFHLTAAEKKFFHLDEE